MNNIKDAHITDNHLSKPLVQRSTIKMLVFNINKLSKPLVQRSTRALYHKTFIY